MSKKYSPVRLRNPNTKNHTVRLLSGQKLHLVFDGEKFLEYKLDLKSSFLVIEEITEISNGWMAFVSQESVPNFDENTLFLGEIDLYSDKNEIDASLCILSQNQNNDFLRIINPVSQSCVLEPNQVLDVVFQSDDLSKKFYPIVAGSDLELELIQHLVRTPRVPLSNAACVENFFRFRFTSESIHYISEQPYAKYNAGMIQFATNKNDAHELKVVCSWRGKPSVYKALLLPKIPNCDLGQVRKCKRQMMQSNVVVKNVDSDSLEDGCNVLLSKSNRGFL